MNSVLLAGKYLVRRRSRGFLVLVVFLVINVMAFMVISVREAASVALEDLEEGRPDCFYLDSKYETDPESVVVEGSTISYLSVPYVITDEVIEKIMSVDGVKAYAVHYAFLSGIVSDENGSALELVAYEIPAGEDDVASIRGVSDSDLYLGSRIKLTEGTHIAMDSEREAMVNVQFAKQNNLRVGDKLTITKPGEAAGIEVVLCGIYENMDETDETELSPAELSGNFIYVDYDTAFALDDGKQGAISGEFFVEDPDKLAAICTQVEKLDIDWDKYSLFNEAEESVIDVDSVKTVANQFSVLTAVVVLAGFFIITLVLMLQTKIRANEIAIFLSLGFTKSRIVWQHMIEAMIPAGISIVAAYLISNYLISNYLISSELFNPGNLAVNGIQLITIVQIILINLCLLIASIWVSGARILNTAPRVISEND